MSVVEFSQVDLSILRVCGFSGFVPSPYARPRARPGARPRESASDRPETNPSNPQTRSVDPEDRPTGLARIEITEDEARVRLPISGRDIVKTMPTRRWSPADRAWILPSHNAPELRARLEAHGYIVRTINLVTGERSPLRLRRTAA
jgi:hypothetical protein